MVNDTEFTINGHRLHKDLTNDVFPAPDGALITNRLRFFGKLGLSMSLFLNYNTYYNFSGDKIWVILGNR